MKAIVTRKFIISDKELKDFWRKTMTKQEQSEKIVYGSLITSTKCYNCIHFPLCFAQKGGANLELASENDCYYYQSKLPENAVVLTREELSKKYVNRDTYDSEIEYRKTLEKRERKKTVKEILQKVKEKALSHCRTINCYELRFIETTIDELLEEYDK